MLLSSTTAKPLKKQIKRSKRKAKQARQEFVRRLANMYREREARRHKLMG